MTDYRTHRPPVMGLTHMVCAGHYLAAAAGYRILDNGGNAVDAGVAAGITINVVLPENTNFGGVAPIMIYLAEADSVVTISGLGRWPRAASTEYFLQNCGAEIPPGILRCVVPSAPDAWLSALERYGTLTLEEVITPALELARNGFPLSAVVRTEMAEDLQSQPMGPSNQAIFMPNGKLPAVGEKLVQSALANTFERLIEVERVHRGRERAGAIRAARDEFYSGDIAQEMARFSSDQGGLLSFEDLSAFSVREEPPVKGQFKDYDVYTCGPWCQGPVVPQALQILERDDVRALQHNSADYIHLVSQALDLCFADRERFYGDPEFVDVPIDALLSLEYARARRELIDMQQAFGEMPPHGPLGAQRVSSPSGTARTIESDTSYVCVVDRWGNAFSATPSDSNTRHPVVPPLGFSLSGRGTQSWLDPAHASSVEPWKRPRLTPNPAIAFKDDKLFMPFGCPGGDAQCQAMVQTFLNIVEFGMNPQAAVEQPRFCSRNFANSFWPHEYLPGRLNVEGRIPQSVLEALSARGHDLRVVDEWDSMDMGVMGVITIDPSSGVLSAGADPRRDTYAIGR